MILKFLKWQVCIFYHLIILLVINSHAKQEHLTENLIMASDSLNEQKRKEWEAFPFYT